MFYFDPQLIAYFQCLYDGLEAVPLSSCTAGTLDLYRPAFGVCVCVCVYLSFLSGTTYSFCSGRRIGSGAKSRTRHNKTTTAGVTGEDSNNSALF